MEWRPIPGYEHHLVSNTGLIMSARLGHILTPRDKRGYPEVTLWYKKTRQHMCVHQALALAFIPNPLGLPTVDHADGNPMNNDLTNLRWASRTNQNCNRSLPANKTGLRGVYKVGDTYIAKICCNKKSKYLGKFQSALEAAAAYNAAAQQLHGEFATINDVSQPHLTPASGLLPSSTSEVFG